MRSFYRQGKTVVPYCSSISGSVDGSGSLGCVQRRGQQTPTAACGARVALVDEFRAGVSSADIDPDDIEQSLLRRRLRPLVAGNAAVEIAELTHVMRRAMLEDLERLLAGTDMRGVDYAVFTGLQIHTPERDWSGPPTPMSSPPTAAAHCS